MSNNYDNRRGAPTISVYLVSDDQRFAPYRLSCMFCKYTVTDGVVGRIDKMIEGDLPAGGADDGFGTSQDVLCKLCKQRYRFLTSLAM